MVPDGYQKSLDTFRRLLLVRSWSPDRAMVQAKKYIAESMGLPVLRGSYPGHREDVGGESLPCPHDWSPLDGI